MKRTVGVVVGSLRRESFNRKIAKGLVQVAPASLDCSFVEIGQLPFYNQDLEESAPPAWTEFRERVRSLDAFLFVTPEYNRGMPAVIKNAVDVASRPLGHNMWSRKPAGIVSASPGALGGLASHSELRQSLFAVGVAVLPYPEMYIPNVNTLLGPDGSVTNEKTNELLTKFMGELAGWIERMVATPSAV